LNPVLDLQDPVLVVRDALRQTELPWRSKFQPAIRSVFCGSLRRPVEIVTR
jgi:hypothetical protein